MGNAGDLNRISGRIISIAVRLILYVLVLFAIIKGVTVSYRLGHDLFYDTSVAKSPGKDINVTIKTGDSTEKTAVILKNAGLIQDELSFRVQARFFSLKVKPGSYVLNTSQTPKEMLETLDAGPEKDSSGKTAAETISGYTGGNTYTVPTGNSEEGKKTSQRGDDEEGKAAQKGQGD